MKVGIVARQADGRLSVYWDQLGTRWNPILTNGPAVSFTIYSQEHAIHMLLHLLSLQAMLTESSTWTFGFFPADDPNVDFANHKWIFEMER